MKYSIHIREQDEEVLDACIARYPRCPFGCAKDGAPNCGANIQNLRCDPARDSRSPERHWTTILELPQWTVEQNQLGGLFLRPHYPPEEDEPRSQFATIYSDGRVGYDHPEEIPQGVRKAIAELGRAHQARVEKALQNLP